MPALPPIANVVRVAMKGLNGALPWLNLLHYLYTGSAPGVVDLTNFAAALDGAWDANMVPLQPVDSSLQSIELTDLTSPTSAQTEDPTVVAGSRVGGMLPASAAALITYGVSLRYRGGHPRSYLSIGVDADLATQQDWTGAFVTEYGNGWNAFIQANIGATFGGTTISALGTVSYRHALNPRVTPLWLPYSANQGTAHAELASQRRRIGRK